ncbi:MAG: hypothetical protein QMB08_00870 [Acidimicrobiales bacterium]|jgi:hypothetical protein
MQVTPVREAKVVAHQRRSLQTNHELCEPIITTVTNRHRLPLDGFVSVAMTNNLGLNLIRLIDPGSY